MGFGFIEPDRYYPRTNYGLTEKSKRQFDESVVRIAKQRREAALADGMSESEAQRAYDNAIAEIGMFRDVSLNQSAKLETQFLDKEYEDVGYDSKPRNLLQRGEEFLDGYDRRPVVFDKYKEQIIRSYFSNISAIYGNKEIEIFKKSKVFDKGFPSKTPIPKEFTTVERPLDISVEAPRAITEFFSSSAFNAIISSFNLKNFSPFILKILLIDIEFSFSIFESMSINFNLYLWAKTLPKVVFPTPIIPNKTRFFLI